VKSPKPGRVAAGTRIENIPKAHRQPAPIKKAVEIGSAKEQVLRLGEDAKASIRPRLRSEDKSATKTLRLYPMPLMPTV
jgi:hypothetical protein